MIICATVFSIIGWSTFSAYRLRVPLSLSVFFTQCMILLAIYAGSLAGHMRHTAIGIFVIGFALGIDALTRTEVRRAILDEKRALLLIFIAGVLLALFAAKWWDSYEILTTDEFSHWALLAKHFAATNRLADANSFLQFPAYPPGMALLQYYYLGFAGYSESVILLAHLIFFVSAAVAIAGLASRSTFISVGVLLTFFVVTSAFEFSIYTVTVDHILAAVLAVVAVACLAVRKGELNAIYLLPALATLPLIKHVGLVFSIVGLAMVAIALASRVGHRKLNRETIGAIVIVALEGFAVCVTFLSWRAHYHSIGLEDAYGRVADTHLGSFFISPQSPRDLAIWAAFWRRGIEGAFVHFSTAGVGQLSFSLFETIFLLAAASLLVILFARPSERLSTSALLLCIAAGGFGFLALLLASYGFYFSEWEAVRLVSLDRYFGSYVFPWTVFILVMGLQSLSFDARYLRRYALRVFTLCALLAPVGFWQTALGSQFERMPRYDQYAGIKTQVETLSNEVLTFLKDDEKPYFVSQGDNGYEYVMFRYEVAPRRTNGNCWALAKAVARDDILTCQKDLKDAIRGYRFLVVRNANEDFWKDFGDYFEPQARGLTSGIFRADWSDDTLHFVRVF